MTKLIAALIVTHTLAYLLGAWRATRLLKTRMEDWSVENEQPTRPGPEHFR